MPKNYCRPIYYSHYTATLLRDRDRAVAEVSIRETERGHAPWFVQREFEVAFPGWECDSDSIRSGRTSEKRFKRLGAPNGKGLSAYIKALGNHPGYTAAVLGGFQARPNPTDLVLGFRNTLAMVDIMV